MFILDPIFPATGIAMATPIADYTAAFVAIVLLVHFSVRSVNAPTYFRPPLLPIPPKNPIRIRKIHGETYPTFPQTRLPDNISYILYIIPRICLTFDTPPRSEFA